MLATAFRSDLSLDLDSVRRQADFVGRAGVAGAAVLGLAGEANWLSRAERAEVVRTAAQALAPRPLLAGVGGDDPAALAADAVAAGAAWVLVPPPPGTTRPTALADLLHSLLREVRAPVLLQDAPQYLGVRLTPELVAELGREHRHLVGVKVEGEPTGEAVAAAVRSLGHRLRIFVGQGGLHAVEALRRGAAGVIPASDLAATMQGVWQAGRRQAWDDAARHLEGALGLLAFELQGLGHFVGCVKHVLHWLGVLRHPASRDPHARVTADALDDLRFWFARAEARGAFAPAQAAECGRG
jgi:2-keto-3-deoxy-L-arabinonate dehydratase